MNKTLIILAVMLNSIVAFSQEIINGKVADDENSAIIGATVSWVGQPHTAVMTDENGMFTINKVKETNLITVSFMGFDRDTTAILEDKFYVFVLKESSTTLDDIVVKSSGITMDKLSPINNQIISTKELAKAACCDLSESFETNASISVSNTDAVTGAREIELLGMAGRYVQTTVENIPAIRGLGATFGMNYIPGTWIQAIDIIKGAGSVVNGSENMVGQINVEQHKPDNAEKLFLNMYVNSFGRLELNANLANMLNEKWSYAILSHGSMLKTEIDYNDDNFRDIPKYHQLNVFNRWKYSGDRLMAQFGARALTENRNGGQNGFESNENTPDLYGFTNQTNRFDLFSKTAILFPETPYRGLGLILNATFHDSESFFGKTPYFGKQNTFYGNLIYQDIFGTTNHTYKTGASFTNDVYDEQYGSIFLQRNEVVPGVFFEYDYKYLDKTSILVGLRNDFHNIHGNFFVPRLHIMQKITDGHTLRLSAGKGYRIANPFAENYGMLVSSRAVKIFEEIKPEVSWTLGASYLIEFTNTLSLSSEFQHTFFENQMIADMEHDGYLYFYNSQGKTRGNSALVELNYGPVENWEVRMGYRYTNNKQYLGKPMGEKVLLDQMYLPKNRFLLNVSYSFPYEKWKVNGTLHVNGSQRIAADNNEVGRMSYLNMKTDVAPAYVNLNAQVNRNFPKFELYLGGENLTGFKMKNPILGANDPFGPTFDAGRIWGPINGLMVYSGIRYKIN